MSMNSRTFFQEEDEKRQSPERERLMSHTNDDNSNDDNDPKEADHPETNLLYENFKPLTEDIRELRIAFEQFRRDIAMGFVPRDILELRVNTIQNQISILEQKFSDLGKAIRSQELRAIGNVERLWLRVGSSVGIIGIVIALADFFFKH
ncbi:MAG TPA: hypothetical protein VL485_13620 [Ktedonobacteraceae bacterium]|nr:hypothetical protein [Ktedonobacteraceae bacterium]